MYTCSSSSSSSSTGVFHFLSSIYLFLTRSISFFLLLSLFLLCGRVYFTLSLFLSVFYPYLVACFFSNLHTCFRLFPYYFTNYKEKWDNEGCKFSIFNVQKIMLWWCVRPSNVPFCFRSTISTQYTTNIQSWILMLLSWNVPTYTYKHVPVLYAEIGVQFSVFLLCLYQTWPSLYDRIHPSNIRTIKHFLFASLSLSLYFTQYKPQKNVSILGQKQNHNLG